MSSNEIITTELFFHGESHKAIKVSKRGKEEGVFLLPKRQINILSIADGKVRFEWPENIAKQKGLW